MLRRTPAKVCGQNPEAIVIGRENVSHLMEDIQAALSPFENQVLEAYLAGEDYGKIAKRTGKNPKAIDNALQRIRSKIHHLV